MTQCEICEEMGGNDCMRCPLGNPCLGCDDYDEEYETCMSLGGCGERREDEIH